MPLDFFLKADAQYRKPIPSGRAEPNVEHIVLRPRPGDRVHTLVYTPAGARKISPVVVLFRGNNGLYGIPDADVLARDLCKETDMTMVVPHLRSSPDFYFPLPVDDGFPVLESIVALAPELGLNPNRIAVIGERAGARVATRVAEVASQSGFSPITMQILVSPIFGSSPSDLTQNFQGSNEPSGNEPRKSFPNTIIIAGRDDPFRIDGNAYAKSLRTRDLTVTSIELDGGGDFFLSKRMSRAAAAIAARAHVSDALLGLYLGSNSRVPPREQISK